MSKQLTVKKDNALINASYTLTLAEQRLILLAVAEAAEAPEKLKNTVIYAKDYARRFNVSPQTAYEALNVASNQLFDRYFSYQRKTELGGMEYAKNRWVQGVAYAKREGRIRIKFADDVLPFLCELKNRFTVYNLEAVAELKSVSAIRLYELLIAWRSVGKTPPIKLTDLREQLGIEPDEYTRMTDFKRRVLDNAIKQINKSSDIKVTYEQHKQGRRITGFSFKFAVKSEEVTRDPNTIDFIEGATDNEKNQKRQKITKAQAEQMAMPGEEWPELLSRLGKKYIVTGLTKKK